MATVLVPALKIHKVTCPYCIVGYAEVCEEQRSGQVQIAGIKDPRRCVTCGSYFKLQPRVQLVGVRMEVSDGRN